MANVSYDTLTIQINADSKKANQSINNLSKNLQNLEKVAKGLNVQAIQNAQKLLQDIANIDFSNVSQGLQDVVNAFKSLDRMTGKAKIKEQKIVAPIQAITNYGDFQKEQQWNLPTFNDDLIKQSLSSTIPYVQKMSDTFNDLKVQMWQTKDAMRETAKAENEMGRQTDKATGKLEKIAKAFKRIVFYRAIRMVIQMITASLKEAIGELAQYDEKFNQAFSELRSSFSFVSRGIVALLNPIIQTFGQLIVILNQFSAEVSNSIGGVLASALGTTFDKATDSVEDYAESLKKAKSASIGLDELNVISEDTSSLNFQSQEVEAQNNLGSIIAQLIETIKPINNAIYRVVNELQPIINLVVSLVQQLIGETSEGVNSSIESLIEIIAGVVRLLAILIDSLAPILKLLNTLNSLLLNQINGILDLVLSVVATLITILGDILAPILSVISYVLDLILQPIQFILNVLGKIFQFIIGELKNVLLGIVAVVKTIVNWFTTGKWDTSLFEAVSKAFKHGWTEFVVGLAGLLDNLVRAILGAVDKIGSFFGQDWGLVEKYGGGLVSRLEESGFYTPSSDGTGATTLTDLTNAVNNNSNSNGSTDVNVYLDSEQIAKKVEQQIDKRGFTTTAGGYKYGY